MSSIISIYTRDDNSYPFGDGVDAGEHHARATAGAVGRGIAVEYGAYPA